MPLFESITDVVEWRLCIGCGACASRWPEQIRLYDFPSEGIRPVVQDGAGEHSRNCLDVCPAILGHVPLAKVPSVADSSFAAAWGQVVEIWEGYATDPEIRYQGSSGGALTAISAYCLERLGWHGVLHIAQDEGDSLRNRTRLSHTRAELLAAAGSRYSPASVCNHLEWVENAPSPCVIIGKPAEIVAVRRSEALRSQLKAKVGVTLSFFCAESPSTQGTTALLKKMGVDLNAVEELKYRGRGWPGHFAAVEAGQTEPRQKMSYQESWAFLQSYRPWSTQIWPDGTGEAADISCGDPWYEQPDGTNPGSSLVVIRTERGREIIKGAMEAGYLHLTPAEPWKLAKSQENVLRKKGAVWGRLWAMRLFGIPTGEFNQKDLFHCWLQLSLKEKLQSTLGTIQRIIRRKLYRRHRLDMAEAVPVGAPGNKSSSV
ncbi:MAG: coenzyme hydrogenase subunit beta [Chthoniobacter sp.]|jgi:coenzyme F420 hydrogenase subunit beta|nr:coenzyme hydrogenase subunit beta [Chthoniobacter sp.]